jgi:signal transduction histidine kinase
MRAPRLTPDRINALLAVGLAVALATERALEGHRLNPATGLAVLLITLPVAARFRHPFGATLVAAAGVLLLRLESPSTQDPFFGLIATLLILYGLGSRAHGWRFWVGGAVAMAVSVASIVIREGATLDVIASAGIVAIGLLIGRALGVLELETDVIQKRGEQALADERARIARELHDVIGHSISVMGVQAGAVRRVLLPEQQREREALLAVEETGRQAVGEMRRLIGLLRPDEEGIGAPSPSLARVEQLAADMRGAGLALELQVEGDLRDLPPGPDLAAYRIVQEALTNVLKHAPAAHVTAAVRAGDRRLEVDVRDDGRGAAAANGHVGHGLVGMRERTALYGGSLRAGPDPAGGFRIHAEIPLA